jgi:Glycine rich protein
MAMLGIATASAMAVTQEFGYTGSEQTFTVPAGVTNLHVLAIGGHGGKAGQQGGAGAEVEGEFSVKPGQILFVEVGGDGGAGSMPSAGGFNGGGEGAGGGGGASDIRANPREEGLFPDSRLIVAGGGGGAGTFGSEGAGEGGPAGQPGQSIPNNEGGGAGTAVEGGPGGSGGCEIGGSGGLGSGGAGGNCEFSIGGGGGGGGYYGGGGGGAGSSFGGGGGGGGSSLVPAGGTSRVAPELAQPEIEISWTEVTPPPVEEPELGLCVATTGGNYTSATCLTHSATPGTGKYEWKPWPFTKAGFSLTNGAATFKTAITKTTINCSENVIAGDYTGPQAASLEIVFSGCKVAGPFGGQCTGESAAPGEFSTGPLAAEFGLVDGSASPPIVGWQIRPASGETFAQFNCGGTATTLTGSVIVDATPVNKMVAAFKLNFSATNGIQKPARFEGGEEQFLTLETGLAVERVGLTMADSIANERLVEIRATS